VTVAGRRPVAASWLEVSTREGRNGSGYDGCSVPVLPPE
jgi:hypothetical protein